MFGYTGKMLFVNLSDRSFEERPVTEEDARNFIGGPALGAKILYEEMPAKADVFGEDSMIGFVSGPLNNTGANFCARYTVVSKSPVTGGWNDANSGGFFGPGLKRAGYDAVFVKGIADEPVYIFINGKDNAIKSAAKIWGKTTLETEEWLYGEHGNNACAALIGPGGENQSMFAAVMNDGHRAAGRGGSGAVMGSKKLKAVVVAGSGKTPVADIDALMKMRREIDDYMERQDDPNNEAPEFKTLGTGHNYTQSVMTNDASIKNFSGFPSPESYGMDDADLLSSQGLEKYRREGEDSRFFCDSCSMGCSTFLNIPSDRWKMLSNTTRPEYETMAAFGSNLLNKDIESVCQANHLCNEYGFDTMSAGATVAWAMECYNNGVLSKEDLDGIDLKWGKGDAVVEIMEKICKNEGIGKILAKGSLGAADALKKGHDYLVVAGGIEEPQHDARLIYGLGRTYMYDPTPARHVKGSIGRLTTDPDFDRDNPDESFRGTGFEDMMAVVGTEIMNASGICAFGYGISLADPPYDLMRQIEAATGFAYSKWDRIALGLRMFNMRHAFNLREGFRRKDVKISSRVKKSDPPSEGDLAGLDLNFDILADNLFNAIGWTMEAVPTLESLETIGGLEAVINDLYPPIDAKMSAKAGRYDHLYAYFMRRRPPRRRRIY